jgi:hypothetical protein
MPTVARPLAPCSRAARARRLAQLRENEIDLQVALTDITEEITSRQWQVGVLVAELREVRRELAWLMAYRPAGDGFSDGDAVDAP